MANRFVITAQLNIQGPGNIGGVVNSLNKQLQGVNVNIGINTPPNTQRQLNQLNTGVANVGNNAKKAANEIEKFGASASSSLRRFAGFTVVASTFFSLSRAIQVSTKHAIDFQHELVKISQVTGTSLRDLKGLTEEVTRLSVGFGVNSNKLLNVAQIFAQAGLSARDTKVALEALAKTDVSPTFDNIADTTEGAIAIMSQFKVEAKGLENILGSLNAVAGKFAVESSDLITAVRRTGGAFKASGGSLNELLALFTSVRATTRESAESIATGFRTIFTRLQRTRTVNFLESLGIQLRDLEGQFVGPYEAIRRLSGALKDLESTDPRFAQIIEELGGFRQVSKVIPLIQEFGQAQKALIVAQQGANSLTDDAAKSNQALAIQIAKVREEFSALIRQFAESSTFTNITASVLKLASAFINVAETLEPLLPLITAIGTIKFGNFVGKFSKGFSSGLPGFAEGGVVPGTGSGDTVPAMLTPGEYVVRKAAVNAIGLGNLSRINKYSTGGIVGKYSDGGNIISTNYKYSASELKQMFAAYQAGTISGEQYKSYFAEYDKRLRKKQQKYDAKIAKSGYFDDRDFGRSPENSGKKKFAHGGSVAALNTIGIHNLGGINKYGSGKFVKNGIDLEDLLDSLTRLKEKPTKTQRELKPQLRKQFEQAFGTQIQGDFNIKNAAANIEPIVGINRPAPLSAADKFGSQEINYIPGGFAGLFLQPQGVTDDFDAIGTLTPKQSGGAASKTTIARFSKHFIGPEARESFGQIVRPTLENTVVSLAKALSGDATAGKKAIDSNNVTKILKNRANLAGIEGGLFEGALAVFANSAGRTSSQTFDFDTPGAISLLNTLFSKPLPKYADAKLTDNASSVTKIMKKAISQPEVSRATKVLQVKDLPPELQVKAIESLRGQVDRKALGGGIDGGTDTVPALLTPGEFVINKQSAARLGASTLNRLNNADKVQKFASGGLVGGIGSTGAAQGIGIALAILPQLLSSFSDLDESTQKVVDTITSLGAQFGTLLFLANQATNLFGRGTTNQLEAANTRLAPEEDRLKTIKEENKGLRDRFLALQKARTRADATVVDAAIKTRAARQAGDADETLRQQNRFNTAIARRDSATLQIRDVNHQNFLNGPNEQIQKLKVDAIKKEIDGIETLGKVLTGVTIAGAGVSAVFTSLGSNIQNTARTSLQLGNSSAKESFVTGGGLSGAGTGAGIGLSIGASTGDPRIAAAATAIGFVIGGLNGLANAAEEANRVIENVTFEKFFEKFQKQLENVSSGRTVATSQLGSFRTGIARLERDFLTANPANKESRKGQIQSNIVGIDTFLTKIAESSSTISEFNTKVGGSLRIFADFTNTPIDELNKRFENQINIQNRSIDITTKLTEAQVRQFQRLNEFNILSGAIKDTILAISSFNSSLEQLDGFINGISSGTSVSNRGDIFGRPEQIINEGQFAGVVKQTASLFGGNADSLAKEAVEAQQALSRLPDVLLQVASQSSFIGEGDFTSKLDDALGGIPQFIRTAITANATSFIGSEAKDEKIISAVTSNPLDVAQKLGAGVLEDIFKFFKESAEQLNEQTNQIGALYDKRRAVEIKLIDELNKSVDIREQQAEFNASLTTRPVSLATSTGFQRDRQLNILGAGNAGLLNNPTAIGAKLQASQNTILAKTIELQKADLVGREKLIAEIDEEKTNADRLSSALRFLSDATSRTAALQKELASVTGRREARRDIVTDFAFGGPDKRRGIARGILGAQGLATGVKLPTSLAGEGFDLLSGLKGKGAFGFLGGKSADDVIAESVPRILKELGGGFTEEDVKKLFDLSTPEADLAAKINDGFKIALDAQTASTAILANQQVTLLTAISKNTADFKTEFTKNFLSGQKNKLESDRSQTISKLTGAAGVQRDIDSILGFVTGKVAAGSEKNAVSNLLSNRDVLPNIISQEKKLRELNVINPNLQSSLDALKATKPTAAQQVEGKFQGLFREKDTFSTRAQLGLTKLGFIDSNTIKDIVKDGISIEETSKLRGLGNTRQAGLGDKLFSNLGVNFDKNGVASGDDFAQALQSKLEEVVTGFNNDRVDINTSIKELTNATGLTIGEIGELFNNSALVTALNNIPKNFDFATFNKSVDSLAEELNKLTDGIIPLNAALAALPKVGFADGGLIGGTGNKDSELIAAMPGEFMLRKKAVQTLGADQLAELNANPQKFARGGRVKKERLTQEQKNVLQTQFEFNKIARRDAFLKTKRGQFFNEQTKKSIEARSFDVNNFGTNRPGFRPNDTSAGNIERIKANIETAKAARETKRAATFASITSAGDIARSKREGTFIPKVSGPSAAISTISRPIISSVSPFGSKPRDVDTELRIARMQVGQPNFEEIAADAKFAVIDRITKIPFKARSFEDSFKLSKVSLSQAEKDILSKKGRKIPVGFADGGTVPGTGIGDTVPALLTPGEFVLNTGAVKQIGVDTLHKINSRGRQKFAGGGIAQNGVGGTLNMSSEAITALNNFSSNVNKLSSSLDNFPRDVTMSVKHTVEVIHNGAQIFAGMQEGIIKLVEATTNNAIKNMIKAKFPDVGGV